MVIPTHALEPLWKNYETFEHSAAGNKNLAERVLGEQVGCWGGRQGEGGGGAGGLLGGEGAPWGNRWAAGEEGALAVAGVGCRLVGAG